MNWKNFVKDGQTFNTQDVFKGRKARQAAMIPQQPGEEHTTIWMPGSKVK